MLLASQEVIFIKPQFFSHKMLSATWSNRSFGPQWNRIGGKGAGCCSLRQSRYIWLDVEEELLPLIIQVVVILNHLGVIHLWYPQKMINCVSLNPFYLQKWTMNFFKKNQKQSSNTWQTLRPPPTTPFPCGRHKCIAPYVFAMILIFFLLAETSQSSKYCLENTYKP